MWTKAYGERYVDSRYVDIYRDASLIQIVIEVHGKLQSYNDSYSYAHL